MPSLRRRTNVLPRPAKLHNNPHVLVSKMSHTPRSAPPLNLLWRNLDGSFTARARGLLPLEFILLSSAGEEFGWLRLRGGPGAELRAGGYLVAFEASERRYRMVVNGEEVLAAGPKRRSLDELEVSCSSRTYQAWASFFRNRAIASYPGNEPVVRLSGGLTGRSYEALFNAEDRCALPIALFLLWHTAANRRRAFRIGPLAGG